MLQVLILTFMVFLSFPLSDSHAKTSSSKDLESDTPYSDLGSSSVRYSKVPQSQFGTSLDQSKSQSIVYDNTALFRGKLETETDEDTGEVTVTLDDEADPIAEGPITTQYGTDTPAHSGVTILNNMGLRDGLTQKIGKEQMTGEYRTRIQERRKKSRNPFMALGNEEEETPSSRVLVS